MQKSCVLVRYSELHKKKGKTRSRLIQTLRQRIQDRLEYEDLDYKKVSESPGRIIVKGTEPEAIDYISEVIGVQSSSLSQPVEASLESIKDNLDLDFSGTFGVRVKSRVEGISGSEWERKLGSYIQEETGAEVDLDDPDRWFKIEVDEAEAFIFTEKDTFEGPGGLPAASQGEYVSLISGGIDSPVAAYRIMRRGGDIFPVYFYNRPYAAEDHLMRFEAVVKELKKFHPSKNWSYGVIDMDEINSELVEVGKGKMVLHRRLMFRVAEKIRGEKGLQGIVTGESMGQKSSQTPQNLFRTSHDLPILRPLLSEDKNDIREEAEEIGTFQYSKIDSACPDMAPNSPSTELSEERLNELEQNVGLDDLVEKAFSNLEIREI
jgi:thiamine biosynthesis protein ThiI